MLRLAGVPESIFLYIFIYFYIFLIIDTASCIFACLEFTYCVSTIGNWIAFGVVLL